MPLALLALVSGSLIGIAGPAEAVPGLITVSSSSPTNSSTFKVTAAVCPAGLNVLGTGWQALGADGEVSVTSVVPLGAPNVVLVTAYEDATGAVGNWSLVVYATCANPVPGSVVVSAVTSSTSVSPKAATVACPLGRRVTGTGFRLTGGAGAVHLTGVVPNAALTTVTATASEDQVGTAASWSLRVFAICAFPLPGLVRNTGVFAPPKSIPGYGTGAFCGAGTTLIGTGGEIVGGGKEVLIGHLWPSGATSVRMLGFEDDTGYSGLWQPVAYAICAT